jgi:hypothetical protein
MKPRFTRMTVQESITEPSPERIDGP